MNKIISKIFKRKNNKLNQYPCNCYLQNALYFIENKEYNEAYSEICWAIIKSGDKLTEEQENRFKDINKKHCKKSNANDANVTTIEKDIEKVEELIRKCDNCKLTECINCEISWTEVAAIRRIIDNYKNNM